MAGVTGSETGAVCMNAQAGIRKEDLNQRVVEIRKDFPILQRQVGKKRLVYLDNAATSQKPIQVLNCIREYYSKTNANVHRGSHQLAAEATEAFELSRAYFKDFINARGVEEINFTKGTTDGINLVANGFRQEVLKKGDEIWVSTMDHHSNIVPWQIAAQQSGAVLREIPVNDLGELDMDWMRDNINDRVQIISTVYISNSLGTINPVAEIVSLARSVGAAVLLDGAQTAPHAQVDVQALDCDFFVFSGHKMFGPTGIGILYGKEAWMDRLPPYQGGGEMISEVSFEKTTYNKLPYKFEAGTPHIAGAIALQRAGEYVQEIGYDLIAAQESALLERGTELLKSLDGLKIIGEAEKKTSVISFIIDGVHNYDLATLLNQQGIAVRDGHHCCQPLMHRFGIEGTCRASFAFYNTLEEVEYLAESLDRALSILR